jgi:hypothetical protein
MFNGGATFAESGPHARRHGSTGFGFARELIISSSGRPVIYITGRKDEVFAKSVIKVFRAV